MTKLPFPPVSEVPAPKPIDVTDRNGKTGKYLLVADRIRWFRRFCAHYECDGRLHTEYLNRVQDPDSLGTLYTERFKATVLINGEEVATGYGSSPLVKDGVLNDSAFETAETSAIGRALANAGFNILDAQNDNDLDGAGPNSFADAPVIPFTGPSPDTEVNRTPVMPPSQAAPERMPAPRYQPIPPAPIVDTQRAEEQAGFAAALAAAQRKDPPATIEEAFSMIFPNGRYAGRTLGDIKACDRNYLLYITNQTNTQYRSAGKFPRLIAAANMVLAN